MNGTSGGTVTVLRTSPSPSTRYKSNVPVASISAARLPSARAAIAIASGARTGSACGSIVPSSVAQTRTPPIASRLSTRSPFADATTATICAACGAPRRRPPTLAAGSGGSGSGAITLVATVGPPPAAIGSPGLAPLGSATDTFVSG